MNLLLSSIGHVCLLMVAMMPQDFRQMGDLAALHVFNGRHREAEAAFEQAIDRMKQNAPADPYMAVLLSNLGALYTKQGKYKQARTTLQKALAIAEKQLPADHPNAATILTNLAGLAEREKKWPLAESYLRRAMRILDASLPPIHRERALVLEHLGFVHFKQEKLSQAESELREALDIERAIAVDAVHTVNVSLDLAKVLVRRREYEEARLLYAAALPAQERLVGAKTAEVATTLEFFSDLLHTMKSSDAAAELKARARRIRAELAYTTSID